MKFAMVKAICYHYSTPHYAEKGTPWEKSWDTALAFIFRGSAEEADEIVRKLNEEMPEYLNKYEKVPEDVDFYFWQEQEDFD